jgi:MFS family permease
MSSMSSQQPENEYNDYDADQHREESEKVHPVTSRINNRVGCGNSQLIFFFVGFLVMLCDGQEMLVMSLVSTRLKSVWELSPGAEGTLGSCVFVGVLIGSVLGGYGADGYGRRPTILMCTSLLALAGLGSAVAPTFPWLVAIRALAGVGLGGTLPCISTLTAEVTPGLFF